MCGISGMISTRKDRFDWLKFNTLGADNDVRGGDSIGRLVGDDYEVWVNPKGYTTDYFDFVCKFENSDAKDVNMALCHTRKSSPGYKVTEAQAQPIVLPVTLSNGEIGMFAMVHNGTLHNVEELSEKYDVDYKDVTDSVVLATIIRDHGYGVLSEYNGGATIVIRDDRKPNELTIFKGASVKYGTMIEEERPLYLYKEDDDTMYFSSRKEGLLFIGGDLDSIEDLPTNVVMTINGNELLLKEEIDRTGRKQVKPYVPKTNTWKKTEDSWDRSSGSSRYGSNWEDDYNEDFYSHGNYFKENKRLPVKTESGVKLDKVVAPDKTKTNKVEVLHDGFVIFKEGRYYKRGELLNGTIRMASYGLFVKKKWSGPSTLYSFYNGILLDSDKSHKKITKRFGKGGRFNESISAIEEISKYSVYPIRSMNDVNGCFVWGYANEEKSEWSNFYGTFKPMFTNKAMSCGVNGSCNVVVSFENSSKIKQSEFTNKSTEDSLKLNESMFTGDFRMYDSEAVEEKIEYFALVREEEEDYVEEEEETETDPYLLEKGVAISQLSNKCNDVSNELSMIGVGYSDPVMMNIQAISDALLDYKFKECFCEFEFDNLPF